MALGFRRAASPAKVSAPRELVKITDYTVDVKTDSRGQDGFVIQPMAGDAVHPKAPNFWIRLEDFSGNPDPSAIRALGRALGRIAQGIATLDAQGVEAGAWSAEGQFKLRDVAAKAPAAAVAPKAEAPAKSKLRTALDARKAAEADGAQAVELDSALENLPF